VKTTLVRAAHFSCGYAYRLNGQTPEQNKIDYGSLSDAEGFGRNFRFEASFSGPVDPLSGMILNLSLVDQWLKQVVQALDHRFLNTDLEYFKDIAPTPENILRYIFNEIEKQVVIPHVILTKVRLFESDERWLDYSNS
jgi:6-pyruvoyltetrahydropterin/6-carboxytetrahydropterin synthase